MAKLAQVSDKTMQQRQGNMSKHADLEALYQQDIRNAVLSGMTEAAAREYATRLRGIRAERIVDAVRALPDYFVNRASEVFNQPGESGSLAFREAVDHVNEALSISSELVLSTTPAPAESPTDDQPRHEGRQGSQHDD